MNVKEKIKELIESEDDECRLLGLSCLNSNKESEELSLVWTESHTWEVTKNYNQKKHAAAIPFKNLYLYLQKISIGNRYGNLIDLYVDHCYERKD